MRPEYYEAIRYRRWHVLEDYAKKKPTQELADVVYELSETIGEKPDRKALRRILHILSVAGLEPRDDEPVERRAPRERKTYSVPAAVMGLPEQHGYTTFVGFAVHAGKVSTVMMQTLERWGYCQAEFAKENFANIPLAVDSMIKAAPYLAAKVDPDWAVSRMASAVRAKKPDVPKGQPFKLPGLWKTIFEEAEDVPHPTTKMKAPRQTPEQREDIITNLPHIQHWRLSLHPKEEVWEDIHAVRWNEEADQQKKEIAYLDALQSHAEDLFRDEVMRDLSQRVRDAAYLLHVSGDPRGEQLLAVGHDFERYRAASDFAKWMMTLTAIDLNANLDEDEFDPGGGEMEWV